MENAAVDPQGMGSPFTLRVDFPVGYRFLADEWLPEGLHPEETTVYARELEKRRVAYLSVMAGTYDSFFLPDYLEAERREGYMASFGRLRTDLFLMPEKGDGRQACLLLPLG